MLNMMLYSLFHVLRYIHLLKVINAEDLPTPEILDHITVQPSPLAILLKPLSSINAPIRQQHQVAFHMALCVMRVRHIPGQAIQLGTADWTY